LSVDIQDGTNTTGQFRLSRRFEVDDKKKQVYFYYITDEGKPFIGGTPANNDAVGSKAFYLQVQAETEERLTRSQAQAKRPRLWDVIDTALLEFHSVASFQVRQKEVAPVYEIPNYWKSKEAETLFCPKPDEAVEDALSRRCKALEKVINEPDGYKLILPGDGDPGSLYTAHEQMTIQKKAMHLRCAYALALKAMDAGWTWGECCEEAAEILEETGISLGNTKSVMQWNREYRKDDTLPHSNLSSKN
jgi:hypothetical protein